MLDRRRAARLHKLPRLELPAISKNGRVVRRVQLYRNVGDGFVARYEIVPLDDGDAGVGVFTVTHKRSTGRPLPDAVRREVVSWSAVRRDFAELAGTTNAQDAELLARYGFRVERLTVRSAWSPTRRQQVRPVRGGVPQAPEAQQ